MHQWSRNKWLPKKNTLEKLSLGTLLSCVLLSAIDMVVFANALEYEQNLAKALEEFCKKTKLLVNSRKFASK